MTDAAHEVLWRRPEPSPTERGNRLEKTAGKSSAALTLRARLFRTLIPHTIGTLTPQAAQDKKARIHKGYGLSKFLPRRFGTS